MKNKLPKLNIYLMIGCFLLIILGFCLMLGAPSTDVYNPDIFSVRRITVGPMISFAGFCLMIAAILYRPKNKQ